MSFVTTQPEALTAAAANLQGIGAAMSAQNAAAAARRRAWCPRRPTKSRR
ncbi:PE family protein [Mycobacterium xenopi 3993]|nr:PE family protein [Mycobacterium xenopi 3993]